MTAARFRLALLLMLVAACQAPPSGRVGPEPATAPDAKAWPAFDYGKTLPPGQRAYRLDAPGSRIDVVVRRDGALARFGHDHVVSVHNLEGYLLLDEAGPASRADLRFRIAELAIDTAEGRERYHLDTTPDSKAVEGTRKNLMEQVLDARQWPFVTLRLDAFSRQQEHYSAAVGITIDGKVSSSRQPFRLQAGEQSVSVEGSLLIRQTDLGLEPFSALGGGLRVADPLEIHFRLVGTRLPGRSAPAGG